MSPNRPRTLEQRAQLYAEAAAIVERERGIGLTLDGLAVQVAVSRRHLQRAYAEVGQTTFRAEALAARMRLAAELLHESGRPIADIASELGYSSQSQFSKVFRRFWGIAPSSAREEGGLAAARPSRASHRMRRHGVGGDRKGG